MLTHLFWARGPLSQLERLCIGSFVRQGYATQLWTYGGLDNAPAGAVLRDARDVLPESALFLNRRGSYAGFSDLFRYTVLHRHGGLYSDTDVVALPEAPLCRLKRTVLLVPSLARMMLSLDWPPPKSNTRLQLGRLSYLTHASTVTPPEKSS